MFGYLPTSMTNSTVFGLLGSMAATDNHAVYGGGVSRGWRLEQSLPFAPGVGEPSIKEGGQALLPCGSFSQLHSCICFLPHKPLESKRGVGGPEREQAEAEPASLPSRGSGSSHLLLALEALGGHSLRQ